MNITLILKAVLITVLVNCIVYADTLKEPKYISKEPKYAKLLLLNNEELVLAFDESKGSGTGYDTVYADVNFNNDLTDSSEKKSREFRLFPYLFTKILSKTIMTTQLGKIEKMGFYTNSIKFKLANFKYSIINNFNKRNQARKDLGGNKYEDQISYKHVVHIIAEHKDNNEKWRYAMDREITSDSDINHIASIDIFNKTSKLKIETSIAKNKMLSITVSPPLPSVTKNGKAILPVLTIKNSKGEIILNEPFKEG